MLTRLKILIRTRLRTVRRAHDFPVLLPHFALREGGVSELGGPVEPLEGPVLRAMRLCDGTRTLSDVARAADVRMADLLAQHDLGRILLWRRPLPPDPPREPKSPSTIVVSPHPDDAPLSAFSALAHATNPDAETLVLDLFTDTGWSRFPERLADPRQVARVRQDEERLMARLVVVSLEMMGLPEATLRGYAMPDVFTASVTGRDEHVRSVIAERIRSLARAHPGAAWRLPLGIGNHVDHRTARDAAVRGLREAQVAADRIEFYEDLPYAAEHPGVPDFSRVAPDLGPLRLAASRPIEIRWKLELNRFYWSQLTWSQLVQVGRYAERVGNGRAVERTWRLDS